MVLGQNFMFIFRVCYMGHFLRIDMYEGMPQSLRNPLLLQSLRTPLWFGGWLIDWVNVACTSFSFFLENHLEIRLHFCFMRRMITRPISRLDLAEFGRFLSGKFRFLNCPDFAAKTGCADFEALPRTVNWIFILDQFYRNTLCTQWDQLKAFCRNRLIDWLID